MPNGFLLSAEVASGEAGPRSPASGPAEDGPSPALDLMEEFRPVIADAVVLRHLATGNVGFQENPTPHWTPGADEPERGKRSSPRTGGGW